MIKRRFLWALIALVGFNLQAQPGKESTSIYDLTLKELLKVKVITAASGFEQNLQRAATNATVITHEEWEAMGAYTLSEVMASVAGVHVTKPKAHFKHNLYTIRGLGGEYGEQVKLLIDGRPMEFMQDSGRYSGFHMPIDQFKRIEVIKGPGSAIYGADAFGGVINLVSYQGEVAPTSITVRNGAFDTHSISAINAFEYQQHRVNLALDYIKSKDDPNRIVSSDLQSVFDQLFNTSASRAPGAIDEHFEVLSLSAQWQWHEWSVDYYTWRNFDLGVGAGIAQALDTKGTASSLSEHLVLDWDLNKYIDLGQLNLSLSFDRGKSASFLYVFPPNSEFPIGPQGNINFVSPVGVTQFSDGFIGTPSTHSRTKNIKLTHQFEHKLHRIRWETGVEHQQINPSERKNFGPSILYGNQTTMDGTLTDVTNTPFVFLPTKSRNFYYVSVLDEWDINDEILVSLGARYDHYSDFGSTTNPRLSLLYKIMPTLSFKLFAGSAFRAPSFVELYAQNNPVSLGNPNLGPEGVNTLETGINADYLINDNLSIALSFFDYQADDLIESVFDARSNGSVSQNVGQQKGQGGEVTIVWKPQVNITINANFSRLNAKNGDDVVIADIPKTLFYVDMNWRINKNWQWFFDAKWVKDRTRLTTDTRQPIADYHRFNSRLAYNNLIPGLTLALKVKNLFDKDAREPSNGSIPDDYPLQGRQWLVQLSYDF